MNRDKSKTSQTNNKNGTGLGFMNKAAQNKNK